MTRGDACLRLHIHQHEQRPPKGSIGHEGRPAEDAAFTKVHDARDELRRATEVACIVVPYEKAFSRSRFRRRCVEAAGERRGVQDRRRRHRRLHARSRNHRRPGTQFAAPDQTPRTRRAPHPQTTASGQRRAFIRIGEIRALQPGPQPLPLAGAHSNQRREHLDEPRASGRGVPLRTGTQWKSKIRRAPRVRGACNRRRSRAHHRNAVPRPPRQRLHRPPPHRRHGRKCASPGSALKSASPRSSPKPNCRTGHKPGPRQHAPARMPLPRVGREKS